MLHSLVDNSLHNFQMLEPKASGLLLEILDSHLLVHHMKHSHWVLVQFVTYGCHIWIICCFAGLFVCLQEICC